MESPSSRNSSTEWACFANEKAEIFATGILILVGHWRVSTLVMTGWDSSHLVLNFPIYGSRNKVIVNKAKPLDL